MFGAIIILCSIVLLYPGVGWLLSNAGNIILHLRYPIRSKDGRDSLPSLPFQWANGQGTEKFFNGLASARRWHTKMGSIYRIWSGFQPEVVFSQPSQTRAYFRASSHHTKAADNNSGWLFRETLGSCVGLVNGPQWRKLRAELERFFTQSVATAYTPTIVESARSFVEEIAGDNPFVGILNPARDLQFFPFFVVAGMLFGEPLTDKQKHMLRELAPMREELFREVIRGGLNRWRFLARLFMTNGAKLLDEFQAKWLDFVESAYVTARENQRKMRHDDPKGQKELPIVSLWEAVQEGRITKKECLQTLDESLYANLDVTTNAVSWNIVLLAQHPDIQRQLREEVHNAQQGDMESYSQYINKSDTLLAMCVLESSRLRPILPFSNPESAPDNKIIDDYVIPHNTNIIIDAHAINVANPFWIDGEKYIPTRHASLKKEQVRYNFWRFGMGTRQCLGKHFADRMLRSITAEIVGRWDLSVVGDEGFQNDSWVGLPDVEIKLVKT